MPKSKKIQSYYLGVTAEIIVIIFLYFKGYKILKRRYKNRLGEVDIVALKRKAIIAIEVKARKKVLIKNKLLFDEVVTFNQRERIKKATISFVKSNKKYHDHSLRFDLVVFSPFKLPLHLEGFWE